MRSFFRGILIFLVAGLMGTGFGIGVGLFLFPFIFPPGPANEQLTGVDRMAIATGTFQHVDPSDPLHWGRGKVSVYQQAVFLEADFEVGPGPKYHVYLVPRPGIRASADLEGQMFVDLGRLRAFKGSQRYAVPPGLVLTQFQSVVIWCEQFNVLISPADLAFASEPSR